MVKFYLLTFPRFPLRKKERKSYFGKNRTHDFRTSRCANYLLDHSGLYSICKHSPLSDGRSNLSPIAVSKRSGLRFEMERWLEVRSRLNGAPWYDATRHVLTISGARDASSQARGGLIKGPFGAFSAFKAATDFPAARQRTYQRQGDVRTTRSTQTGDNDPPRRPQGEHRGRRRRS